MNVTASLIIICATCLIAQYRHHIFKGIRLQERIQAIESKQAQSFDAKAFAELQSKVEALRIAQSLRGAR